MSTLVGHFVLSPRQHGQGRIDIEEIVEEIKERDRGERKMNESEEPEEITRKCVFETLCPHPYACP